VAQRFFNNFVQLTFFLLYLVERYRWRSVLPWLCFFDQAFFPHSILFSITCISVTGGVMMNTR